MENYIRGKKNKEKGLDCRWGVHSGSWKQKKEIIQMWCSRDGARSLNIDSIKFEKFYLTNIFVLINSLNMYQYQI